MSMVIVAASLFHGSGLTNVEDIDGAYEGFKTLISNNGAVIFGIALLMSGFASSSIGTMSGQVVMQGFIQRRIPIFVRRAVTLAPALVIVAIGVNPSSALVFSQVVLSFGIPFALVPLVLLTSKREVMGDLVNKKLTNVVAAIVATLIIALNIFLLYQTFT
jgi:manganese transport protein